MININLLPEVLRKKERMPLPHLLGLIGCLVAFCALGFFIFNYHMFVIPGLERTKENLERQRADLRRQVDELNQINGEIARLSSYVDTVKNLYRQRIVWSKILFDIKNIINFDPITNELNPEMRYIWLTKLTGKGKQISLTGFATGANRPVSMQMYERFIQNLLNYTPVSLPEKDEEARLQEELRAAQIEHDALRRENPDLPLQGPKETAIQQRLEEIKNIKSGGIAMKPFNSLLAPGGAALRLLNAAWTTAPIPQGGPESVVNLPDFPKNAWSFAIDLQMK